MKAFNFLLIFSFALLFIQCKEKSNQENIANDPEAELNTPDEDGTVIVTVYNYTNKDAMSEVEIAIQVKGVTTGFDTTNADGEATLTMVESIKEYTFRKKGYATQSIQFEDYIDIDKLNVYMKSKGGNSSSEMNIRGVVYNSTGQPINNVIVKSNEQQTRSQQNGTYSLNIQNEQEAFPLQFVKGDIDGGLSMNINEDTVIVDVFIDGFTVDTTTINK